jgi:hypothetical protein
MRLCAWRAGADAKSGEDSRPCSGAAEVLPKGKGLDQNHSAPSFLIRTPAGRGGGGRHKHIGLEPCLHGSFFAANSGRQANLPGAAGLNPL